MKREKIVTGISLISIALAALLIVISIPGIVAIESITSIIQQPKYMDKIFNKDLVSEIEIKIDEDSWKDLLENATKEEYYKCDIIINGETFSNVGIRAKGNSSLSMVASDSNTDRYSFKIKFNEYIKGQNYYGLEKLALNNNMSDATSMKEYLSYEMFEEMGVATPGFSYTSIKLNNEVWGLYLVVEVIEESFIERNFGSIDGNLYKPEGMEMGGKGMNIGENQQMNKTNPKNIDVDKKDTINEKNEEINGRQNMKFGGGGPNRGSTGTNLVYNGDDISSYSGIFDNAIFKTTDESDYKTVIEMMKNLSEGTNLEEYLDLDEILRYFAVNTFLVNLDSYAGTLKHNYYLYERDGKLEILPWDFNLSFAGHEVKDATSAINFPIDNPVSDTMENSPLISKLLEKNEYKDTYHKYLEELVVNYIKSGKYEASISKVNELIKEYIKEDPTAFFTYSEYESSLPVLLQFGKDRSESIIAQLNGQQSSTTYGNISTNIDLSLLGSMNKGGGDKMMGGQQGEKPDGFQNLEDRDTMRQAMEIIMGTVNGELSEEQKNKLIELGINETQIEEMVKIEGGRPQGDNSRPIDNGNFTPPGNIMSQDNINNEEIILVTISAIALILALMYISKVKGKKYIITKPPLN